MRSGILSSSIYCIGNVFFEAWTDAATSEFCKATSRGSAGYLFILKSHGATASIIGVITSIVVNDSCKVAAH
jgi:hypothetical protein